MKIRTDQISQWSDNIDQALPFILRAEHAGATRDDVLTGSDAWSIASMAGVTRNAYLDKDVTDGHIQTALERIFPNAVFKDKKRY